MNETNISVPSSSMLGGFVKRLEPHYGFLRGDDANEYFFLPASVEPKGLAWTELKVGDYVQFAPFEHERGLRAEHVRRRPWI